MNKFNILNSIISTVSASFEGAVTAADEARATATNKENVAENKYDTLGLEAAYLAHGQSKRGLQLEQDLAAFVSLKENLTEHNEARLGSLVEVEQPDGEVRYLFIGPGCGGLKIDDEGEIVTVITPASPLGSALLNAAAGDEVSLDTGASPLCVANVW